MYVTYMVFAIFLSPSTHGLMIIFASSARSILPTGLKILDPLASRKNSS